MNIGDLVMCTFQPSSAGVDKKTDCCIPMKHTIKGEVGIIESITKPHYLIMFPQFSGYTHNLSSNAFEVVNESR
jgi:hypothetical protein